jgi:hypothetical protein
MTTQEVLDTYGDAWNEKDETKRRQLLEKCWADDGTFTDPQSDIAGREALVAHIAEFQAQFDRAQIMPTSTADEHHGMVRFTWRILAADGSTMLDGIDFSTLAEDGRIQKTVGFFGPPPNAN